MLKYIEKDSFDKIVELDIAPTLKARLFADCCRINILYMIAKAGSGHIGTSFSSIDILSWLFLEEMRISSKNSDIYFSSKGHDVPAKYSILMAKGLLDFSLIDKLRRLGGLPGHPDVSIPYMHTNTGSLGMGISKARGMALSRRLKNEQGRIFVLTGDGELQEGQFWESLQPTANQKLSEITVIVDHNKIQSDTFVEDTSSLGDLEKKLKSFDWHVERINGNDFNEMQDVFQRIREIDDRPKIIIADTIKGAGVSFMHGSLLEEGKLYDYHSGAPTSQEYERALEELKQRISKTEEEAGITIDIREKPTEKLESVQVILPVQKLIKAYSEALLKLADKNPNLVALDADLILDTGLIPFKEEYPERFFECGIAEQDMVSQAGGMALNGLVPVVHSFSCFLSARPNEQIFNNATEKTKIVYVGSLAGLLPSGPGHSHQCVRDISSLSAVPNILMAEPSCEAEVEPILSSLLDEHQYSGYLRLVSIPCAVPYSLPASYKVEIGKGTVISEGEDAVIISYGPVMLSSAYNAAKRLRQKDFNVKVVNLPWLNQVNSEWLRQTIGNAPILVTLDNHFVKGGQGEYILSEVAKLNIDSLKCVAQLGVDEIPLCGRNDEVLEAHGLSDSKIASYLLNLRRKVSVPCSF